MARKEYAGGAPETTLTSSMTNTTPGAGQTFTVASGTGYPTGAYAGGFVVVVDVGTPSEEKILCSARSGNTFTVATSGRGFDGTTAVPHGGGSTTGTVNHCFDADSADDFGEHIALTAAAHAASAISYAGGTGMSATDVEAAIDELATEKANLAGGTFTGDINVPDEAYDATNWNGSTEVPTKNAVRDKIEDILDGVTFTGDVVVPVEAYGVGWNGSNEAPTKNDLYDKIETLASFNYYLITGFVAEAGDVTTATQMERLVSTALGGTTMQSRPLAVPMVRAGSITGLSIAMATTRSSGSMTAEVYKNGSATGLTVTIDGTNTQYHTAAQAVGTDTFAAGDRIDVRATNSSYVATTGPLDEFECTVEVAF